MGRNDSRRGKVALLPTNGPDSLAWSGSRGGAAAAVYAARHPWRGAGPGSAPIVDPSCLFESYVADNKTFCVYLAKDEAVIRKHADMSGFPATQVTEVKKMIDPTTENA